MADFGLPVLTSTYSDMVDTLKARDIDGLIWLDGATSVGLPTGAKRWNSTNNYFEKFSGSTWLPLAAKYMINVDYVDGCSVNDLGDTITDLWTASKIGSMLNNKLNVLDYNATDILTKLKTVDGTGSGLDADLLDGMGATNTNTFNTIVARDASGNFSAGAITVASVNGITGLSSISPLVAGVGTAGTSSAVARQDHVHPLQVNISGNAATATNAATAAACSGNSATATWAASCESANKLIGKNWYWSGQGGQPNWLWGGSDGTNMYVYSPANFSVNYANSSNYSNSAGVANSISTAVAISAIAGANTGEIGTYAFLLANGFQVNAGGNYAGSSLRYVALNTSSLNNNYNNNISIYNNGAVPTGTWKCMGHSAFDPDICRAGITLFLRIA